MCSLHELLYNRLLDMGFEKEISHIMNFIQSQASDGSRHQTVLLSATLSTDVKRLASYTLHEPEVVDVASRNSVSNEPVGQHTSLSVLSDNIYLTKWFGYAYMDSI